MGKDKSKKSHQHHKSSKKDDDGLWENPSPKESKTKNDKKNKKDKPEKRPACHTSKNIPKSPNPFSSTCQCTHQHLPPSFPYKEFPPPAPPEGGRDLWDLQFCRWWGWNWVRKRESMMATTQKRSNHNQEKTEGCDSNKKSCMSKCRTDDETVVKAEMRMKKASFISEHKIQSPPPLSAKGQFKEMCKCLFGKKTAPRAVAKMYKTPSASRVYLEKEDDDSDSDSDSSEEIPVKESKKGKEKPKKEKSHEKSGGDKREKEKLHRGKEKKVKSWRRENFAESTASYSEPYSVKNVPCLQKPQPAPPPPPPVSKSSIKSSKKESKEKKGSSTEESIEYLTFRLHHIRENEKCPCNSQQPAENLQIYLAETPSCCLGIEKQILPQCTATCATAVEETQVVASTSAHIPEKLSCTASKGTSPEPKLQEDCCQSNCLGLMDQEVCGESEERSKVCQETQTQPIVEVEKSCAAGASSYVEKLVKVKSKRQKTICIMVCCCNNSTTTNPAITKAIDEPLIEPPKKCDHAAPEGCVKYDDYCSCGKCPRQCWTGNKKTTPADPKPELSNEKIIETSMASDYPKPELSNEKIIETSMASDYTDDSGATKKNDYSAFNNNFDGSDDISALFATAITNKKLSKFGTPSKKYPWMDSLTSAGTTTSLDHLGYHNNIISDILERDSSSMEAGKHSIEDRVILEAMCDVILQEEMDSVYTFLDEDILTNYKELGVDCDLKISTKDAFSGSSNFIIEKPEPGSIDNINSIMDTIFSRSGHATPNCKQSKEMTCTTYDRYEYVPKPVGLLAEEVKRAPKRPLELGESECKKKLKQEELMPEETRENERMNNILTQIEQIVNKSKEKSAEIQKILNFVPQPADLELSEDSKKRCYAICSDSFKGTICNSCPPTPKITEEGEEASRIMTLNQGNMIITSSESNDSVSKKISKLSIQNFVVCDEKPKVGANFQLLGTSGAKGTKRGGDRSSSLIPVLKANSGNVADD